MEASPAIMVREEEEVEGREEKEEEEMKRKGAHINTYATQTKTYKGPRSWQIRSCGMQIRAY